MSNNARDLVNTALVNINKDEAIYFYKQSSNREETLKRLVCQDETQIIDGLKRLLAVKILLNKIICLLNNSKFHN